MMSIVAFAGCATSRPHATDILARATLADPRPLVLVVDGAGGLGGCSTALTKTADDHAFEVVAFPWSHGQGRLLLDQIDVKHARRQGRRLADAITRYKAHDSGRRIVLVAHSAGAAVALAAAEALPPHTIDRLILLAPAVSDQYDLGPAAHAAREGVDVFCSKKDIWALGVAMRLFGTTDGRRTAAAAGRHGFRIPQDSELARQVRQHFWSPELISIGHNGGHYGAYSPEFIRHVLSPMLNPRSYVERSHDHYGNFD
jgi:pimeloyl-ACP methyl ester carboxylesterase